MKSRYLIFHILAVIIHFGACVYEGLVLFILLFFNYDFRWSSYAEGAAVVIGVMIVDFSISFLVRKYCLISEGTLHIFNCMDLAFMVFGLPVIAGLFIVPIQGFLYGFDDIGPYILVFIVEFIIIASRVMLYVIRHGDDSSVPPPHQ